jgi:predicted RNA-binding Zn-ribbon protein involved in translation (DUF1610 family)
MKKSLMGFLVLSIFLLAAFFTGSAAWAIKNVCPDCNFLLDDMELFACPNCGKIINKCLICGTVNPIKNDNCSECSASLAESRVLRKIDKEVREELRLGESDRARIDVELGQIKEKIEKGELTTELAAREIELLTKMDWWSKANIKAIEFAAKFPDATQNPLVKRCRVKSLRQLGFLAMEDDEYVIANEYLKTALELDPNDKKAANLLKISQNEIKKE